MSGELRRGTKPELFLVTRSQHLGKASSFYFTSDARGKSRYEKRGHWISLKPGIKTDQVIAGTAGVPPAMSAKREDEL